MTETDLRVRRTQKLLKASLLELLGKTSLTQITINNIADNAMVHRTTFYAHYQDKFALLEAIFDDRFATWDFAEFETTPFQVINTALNSIPNIAAINRQNQDATFQAILTGGFIKHYRLSVAPNSELPLEKWLLLMKLNAVMQWSSQSSSFHDLRTEAAYLDDVFQHA